MAQRVTEEYSADIRAAVDVLRRGGVILYPTDTIWGIGCDATNSEAVKRIFKIKERSDAKALITLVGSLAQLERTVEEVPEVAYQLLDCAVSPLTIVYDSPAACAAIAPELLAQNGTIGVRLTTESFSAELCRMFGRPLVSTSANISGEPSPRTFSEISSRVKDAVDYICLSRREETAPGKPSGVIRLTAGGVVKVIR